MASESAVQALSPAVTSFVICGRTWKLGDPIHSTGVGANEKKNGPIFWRCFRRIARVEGVSMGHGSGQKYRVKWTNLSEELICEYGANHWIFQYLSKERPLKVSKFHGPQRLSLDPARSSPPVSITTDVTELHPSSGEDSEADDVDPQIPGISPLEIGYYDSRMDPSFNCLDPRVQGLISSHIACIAFVEYSWVKNGST